jgi:hypothetical protein
MTRVASLKCLHCEGQLKIRTSRIVVPTLAQINLQCDNLECGATYGAAFEITHGISAGVSPREGVEIRMAPPRRVADNDNMGRQTIASAPEVAPAAANDDGALGEAVATGS